jgi:hypothetical protein
VSGAGLQLLCQLTRRKGLAGKASLKHGMDFEFYPVYTKDQLLRFIDEFLNKDSIGDYVHRNSYLEENYFKKFETDYASYRDFVFTTELTDLLKLFKEETRFCLVNCDNDMRINSVVNELKINAISVTDSLQSACERFMADTDVFITIAEGQVKEVQKFLLIKGESTNRVLGIEKYMRSVEPKEVFLKNSISSNFILI